MSQYYYNPFGNNSDVYEAAQARFLIEQKKRAEKKEIRIISLTMGCAIIAYILLQYILRFVLVQLNLYNEYMSNPVLNYSIYVLCISFLSVLVPFGIMALINRKRYTYPVIPKTPIKLSSSVAWIGFGMGCCIVANYIVAVIITVINSLTGFELAQGEMTEPNSVFSCILLVMCLSIMPGICEELAMRCFSLQLLRKYGKGFAVFAVSIVFGLLHGNVVQFIFAFLVGLVLGYITVKTDSIVPAIFTHAFNNGMSVLQYIVKYAFGENMAEKSTVFLYVFWFVFAVFSLVYLIVKKEFKTTVKETSNSVLTTGEKFTAFLFPWMIVPFGVLIYLTVLSIA